MLASPSAVKIAVAAAAVIGYSAYLIFRRLTLSRRRSYAAQLPNTSGDSQDDDDSTFANFEGPVFYKAANYSEDAIYRILGSHPRIVKYLGSDPMTGQIRLASLRNDPLLLHLRENPSIPLATRLTWAIEISQGVAHLHARDVIWADPHLYNVIMSDDYHAVLCGFGLSVHKAPYHYNFIMGPPMIYGCPFRYGVKTPRRVDIFGLGVMLFVLLSGRFPFHKDLFPSIEEEVAVTNKYERIISHGGVFDKLPSSLDSYFGNIVAKCFAIEYQSADILVTELEAAFSLWWKENEQNFGSYDSVSTDIPYPRQPVHLPIERVNHEYTFTAYDPPDNAAFQYNESN